MLPLKARILVKDGQGKGFNLWVPLFLLWPLLILALPVLLLVGMYLRPKILPLLSAAYGLLVAVRGFVVEIEDKETQVKIMIK